MKKSNRQNIGSFCDLRLILIVFIIPTFLLNGCATTWENKGSFYQTIQTDLVINSVPEGMVYIDNKYVGKTPFTTPVKYEQKVNKKSRKASYWETQPGLSLLLTMTSLGIYLPFSFIPVDNETSLDPANSFRKNEITVGISAEGYTRWEDKVILNGEKNISLKPILEGLDK
jgi:hypothetical protein